MNRFTKKIIVGIALSVLGISAIFGVTNSKYTSSVRGAGMAQVAQWDFKVNGETQLVESVNLFQTYNPATLVNGKLAPGTSGSFQFVIDAQRSDVGIDYAVKFENDLNKPTNLKFKYNNTTVNTLQELEPILTGRINANDANKTKTIKIDWVWDYESGSDQTDTNEGTAALDYTFDLSITGTQVVPQKQS